MDNKRYRRYFIILDNEDEGFHNKQGKNPKGYTKIETKNGKGVLNHYVQNLKYFDNAEYIYRGYLIGTKDGKHIYADSGTLVIDENGKGELSWKFNPENVDGKGNAIKDFNVIAIVAEATDIQDRGREIIAPLVGFIDKQKVAWKNILAEGYIKKEKQQETEKKVEQNQNSPVKEESNANEVIEPLRESIQEDKKVNPPRAEANIGESIDPLVEKGEEETEEIQNIEAYKSKEKKPQYGNKEWLEFREHYAQKEVNIGTYAEKRKEKPEQEKPEQEKPEQEKPEQEKPEKEKPEKEKPEQEKPEKEKPEKEKPEKEKPEKDKNDDKNKEYNKKTYDYQNAHPYYNHYSNMVHEYVKNTLKYHKEIAPFEKNLEGCRWWKIPCNSQTLYRNFMPFYGYLANIHCYHPYMNYMTGCPALIHKYQHYIFGIASDKDDKPIYYMYGVPGKFMLSEQPYEGMTGFVYWHPLQDKKGKKGDYGYWILHIDAKTGNVVMPRKPTPPPCC